MAHNAATPRMNPTINKTRPVQLNQADSWLHLGIAIVSLATAFSVDTTRGAHRGSTGFAAPLPMNYPDQVHDADHREGGEQDDAPQHVQDHEQRSRAETQHDGDAGKDDPQRQRAVGRRGAADAGGRIVVAGQAPLVVGPSPLLSHGYRPLDAQRLNPPTTASAAHQART